MCCLVDEGNDASSRTSLSKLGYLNDEQGKNITMSLQFIQERRLTKENNSNLNI